MDQMYYILRLNSNIITTYWTTGRKIFYSQIVKQIYIKNTFCESGNTVFFYIYRDGEFTIMSLQQ